MTTYVVDDGGQQCLHITEELTIYTAAAIKAVLQAALASPGLTAVDLAGVTEIDTAGLQVLLAAQRSATAQGRPLGLGGCSDAVRDGLALCDLRDRFGRFEHLATPATARHEGC